MNYDMEYERLMMHHSPRGVYSWPCKEKKSCNFKRDYLKIIMNLLVVDEEVSMSGVDGEVMSPHNVDVVDVVEVQEKNMETKMGRGMRNKIPSTIYKDFVTHIIWKVNSSKIVTVGKELTNFREVINDFGWRAAMANEI
ncbi:unnamed protein product [Sphenostylis stenocarpa]|uniref:Uncharacterized protein n=1 Tax=Sphenostylis stenocarpa TaxID=92480 RepID=A0AA86SUV9_9FABA|nr:unnamed protein product [Sphenostylis stenocarpa]